MPRPYAILLLWSAVALAAYMTAFILIFQPSLASGAGSQYTSLLLVPVLVQSGLINGARERFGVRMRGGGALFVALGVIVVIFIVMVLAIFVGVTYPWWVSVVVGAVLLGLMGARPALVIMQNGAAQSAALPTAPLSRPVRWMTALIGVALGAMVALSVSAMLFAIASIITLAALALLVAWHGAWGLPRAGFEWGRAQWVGFGVVVVAVWTTALLLARTEVVSWPISAGVGLAVAGVMIGVSRATPRGR